MTPFCSIWVQLWAHRSRPKLPPATPTGGPCESRRASTEGPVGCFAGTGLKEAVPTGDRPQRSRSNVEPLLLDQRIDLRSYFTSACTRRLGLTRSCAPSQPLIIRHIRAGSHAMVALVSGGKRRFAKDARLHIMPLGVYPGVGKSVSDI